MIKRSLEEIMKDIRATEARAATDVNLIPRATRAAFEIAVRQANERLVELRAEYRARVFSNIAAFFVTGERQAEFVATAEKNHGTIPFDATKLYRMIADRVEPSMGRNREFTINQWGLFVAAIRDVAVASGLTGSLPSPKLSGNSVVKLPTSQDLVAFLRNLIRTAMGDSLFIAYAGNEISTAALAAGLTEQPVTVAVINAGIDESRALAPSFSIRRSVKVPAEGDLAKVASSCIDRLREPPAKKATEKKPEAENT